MVRYKGVEVNETHWRPETHVELMRQQAERDAFADSAKREGIREEILAEQAEAIEAEVNRRMNAPEDEVSNVE